MEWRENRRTERVEILVAAGVSRLINPNNAIPASSGIIVLGAFNVLR
ncbi:hypothetical protein FP2506_05481 [Fulvimarina pelagi HTCC2506]|uniref:Uncharacterized protein n=1 Tax=Fulvimarina pelagi HTCC2506 TaxID=314231 RepID=Q0G7V0_9HYPH|nr:hypothetical protein FP2506_05481 [Fulvimarina pelagi HTCC2506]